jgi:hypothetical protein
MRCAETSGCIKAQKSIRYAMLNNKVTTIWNDVGNSGSESKDFLEKIEKFHKQVLERRKIADNAEETGEICLKDPPVSTGKSVTKENHLKHPSEDNVEQKNKKEYNTQKK